MLVESLIEEEISAGVPAERIVLGGFSQGGALAMYAGLKTQHKLSSLLILSSYVPRNAELHQLASLKRDTSVFMAHGTMDNVIAVKFHDASVAYLRELNFSKVISKK
jgi:predicted esterase